MIQDQVKLPVSIALAVVLRGIRIRFGRSLVTIMGVTLGIAFLMSILTGQTVKSGVGEEDALRRDVDRMYQFLVAEMGPPTDRAIGVVQTGALSEAEQRLVARLDAEGLRQFNWAATSSELTKPDFDMVEVKTASLQTVGADASALMLIGDGALPPIPWDDLFAGARMRVLSCSRKSGAPESAPEDVSIVVLERELRPDEIAKIEKDRIKNTFRSIWIICISLLVTVIGISNAMLMSVTERFREIGTMKCLGALSAFIRRIFLIESSLMGIVGGISGAAVGALFSVLVYSVTYGPGLVFASLNYGLLFVYFVVCVIAGVVLSVVAAIYPASVASSMVPADALRSNV